MGDLEEDYQKWMKSLDNNQGQEVLKIQQSLRDAVCQANLQDKSLAVLLELMCLHNIAPNKFRSESFMKFIDVKEKDISHAVLVETLLHLSLVVEEKIAKEMKGKKGCILHDGWSKYGRHYVALMVSYLIEIKKGEWKTVVWLVSCTTLPHDEDSNCKIHFIVQFLSIYVY